MILQLGSFLTSAISGLGSLAAEVGKQLLPVGLDIGQQFLQRELGRKEARRAKNALKAQAVQGLNSPGISVATVGGTVQPVGGRVNRSTFTPAAFAPAQSAIGNVPLPPIPISNILPSPGVFGRDIIPTRPGIDKLLGQLGIPSSIQPTSPAVFRRSNGMANGALALRGEPRFATDEFGRVLKFVPSPRPGEGFITVQQAQQLGLRPTRPFYRFNRLAGQFEKVKRRRMNPLNIRATERAARRVNATIDTVKGLLKIQKTMTTGKVRVCPKRRKRRTTCKKRR